VIAARVVITVAAVATVIVIAINFKNNFIRRHSFEMSLFYLKTPRLRAESTIGKLK
jgi:hypothetical protein